MTLVTCLERISGCTAGMHAGMEGRRVGGQWMLPSAQLLFINNK